MATIASAPYGVGAYGSAAYSAIVADRPAPVTPAQPASRPGGAAISAPKPTITFDASR